MRRGDEKRFLVGEDPRKSNFPNSMPNSSQIKVNNKLQSRSLILGSTNNRVELRVFLDFLLDFEVEEIRN